jgi:hypothetical protein
VIINQFETAGIEPAACAQYQAELKRWDGSQRPKAVSGTPQ